MVSYEAVVPPGLDGLVGWLVCDEKATKVVKHEMLSSQSSHTFGTRPGYLVYHGMTILEYLLFMMIQYCEALNPIALFCLSRIFPAISQCCILYYNAGLTGRVHHTKAETKQQPTSPTQSGIPHTPWPWLLWGVGSNPNAG